MPDPNSGEDGGFDAVGRTQIYIYIYRERGREGARERERERVSEKRAEENILL